jgi:hypothetical protein
MVATLSNGASEVHALRDAALADDAPTLPIPGITGVKADSP